MKKCQQCGAPLQDDDRFCQACGAEQLPEGEPKKRICPECGKWVSVDGKFCPFCGAELPKMDDDEPVIDEATGTETFVHKHREPVRDEEPQRPPQPMERPVMTGRPTPPPFQEKPLRALSEGHHRRYRRPRPGSGRCRGFSLLWQPQQRGLCEGCRFLSQQLASENESATSTAKRLSQKSKGDDVDSWSRIWARAARTSKRWPRIISPRPFPTSMPPMTRLSAKSCATRWPCMTRP